MASDAHFGTQRSSIDVIASALEPVSLSPARFSSPDGAVTLMFSDIADAPSVAERLGSDEWACVVRDQGVLAERVVAHHDGEMVKVEQDGFLATFGSAHAALRAAMELQRTFRGPARASDDRPVALRIGLHAGFVLGDPQQPLGRNVVLASRIAAQARGGEILVSSTLKEYTERDPTFEFEVHGEYHFKGVLGEHTVYSLPWR